MNKYSTIPITTMVATFLPMTSASAHWGDDDYMHHMGYAGGFFGFFMMLLVIGLLVAAIIAIVRWFGESRTVRREQNTALDILEERFSKGEIDKNEFDDRQNAMEK